MTQFYYAMYVTSPWGSPYAPHYIHTVTHPAILRKSKMTSSANDCICVCPVCGDVSDSESVPTLS